jgi:hypothetical protein
MTQQLECFVTYQTYSLRVFNYTHKPIVVPTQNLYDRLAINPFDVLLCCFGALFVLVIH